MISFLTLQSAVVKLQQRLRQDEDRFHTDSSREEREWFTSRLRLSRCLCRTRTGLHCSQIPHIAQWWVGGPRGPSGVGPMASGLVVIGLGRTAERDRWWRCLAARVYTGDRVLFVFSSAQLRHKPRAHSQRALVIVRSRRKDLLICWRSVCFRPTSEMGKFISCIPLASMPPKNVQFGLE